MHLIFLALVNDRHLLEWKFAFYTSSTGFCHICIVVDLSYSTGDYFLVIFFADTRTTMHNKWDIYSCFYSFKYRHIQFRLCQIKAMCSSERACQCVNTCFINKRFCQLRICIDFFRFITCWDSVIMSKAQFSLTKSSNLSLYRSPLCMCKFHCDLGVGYVLFIWKCRAIEHNRRKSNIQCFVKISKCFTMIQMNTYRHFGNLCSFNHDRSDHADWHHWFMYFCMHYDYRHI